MVDPQQDPIIVAAWEQAQRKAHKQSRQKSVVQVLFFMTLLLGWHLLSTVNLWASVLFPSPADVVASIIKGIADHSLLSAIIASLKRLVVGYTASLSAGILFGLLIGRLKLLDATLGTLSLGFQALPSICWLPLAILWFGLSEGAMLFVIIMGSLMAVVLSVRDGVKSIPPLYLRASRVMGAAGWKLYLFIILPACLPAILTGARLGWSFAWRSLMAAELLYVSTGLGSTLMMGRELHDMALVVATMLVIIAIGLIFDRLIFGSLERVLGARWGLDRK